MTQPTRPDGPTEAVAEALNASARGVHEFDRNDHTIYLDGGVDAKDLITALRAKGYGITKID